MLNGFWEAIQGLNQVKPHCLINLGNILPIIVVIFLLEMKQAVKSKRSSKVFCKKTSLENVRRHGKGTSIFFMLTGCTCD